MASCGLHSGAQDAAEQTGSDGAIGEWRDRLRSAWPDRHRSAYRAPDQRSRVVANPLRKLFGRHRIDVEVHVGKAVAAELGRQPAIGSGMVGLQVKARHHSRHGVDLAAELRHEEAVHDARRGQLEADRRADRDVS